MASKVGSGSYKLFVGNLPWTIANRQLREYFSQFGQIFNAVVVFDKTTGMSKGFGFITFATEKSMNSVQNRAHHMLEGHNLQIKPINVSQKLQ